MRELLDVATGLPQQSYREGDVLLRDGERSGRIYVLLDGALRVDKHGTPVAVVVEPGACVGEISALLDLPHTADVVASEDSVVAVVEDASERLAEDAEFTLLLARLLASRLQMMTTYLADLKRQYGDDDSSLAMVDTVLGALAQHTGRRSELGSERDPDPEY